MHAKWWLLLWTIVITARLQRRRAWPRRPTPHLRSGAEARRTPCPRNSGQEELPHVRGQGQWPRAPGCDGAGMAKRSYPTSEVRGGSREELPHSREELPYDRGQGRWPRVPGCDSPGAAERSYPTTEVRGGSREEQPHVQGVVAAGVAGGPKGAIPHSRQEGRRWGDTPHPR